MVHHGQGEHRECLYLVSGLWLLCPQVGCGVTSYREGAWYSTLYTCNYGPNGGMATLIAMTVTIITLILTSGNLIGGSLYTAGPACSQCPPSTSCSDTHPGLCEVTANTQVGAY